MPFAINKVIGGTVTELEERKCNIFVPVSLGNKWFTTEHIREYVNWSLGYSRENVAVVIVDKLYAINLEVKDHFKPPKAMRKAQRMGAKFERAVVEIVHQLPINLQRRIIVLRWEDVEKDSEYQRMKALLLAEFENNPEFKKAILGIVKQFVKNIKARTFKTGELEKLAQFVLLELPAFLQGIRHNNAWYALHPYPVHTPINELVESIKKGGLFQELYQKIGKPKSVIVQLEVK